MDEFFKKMHELLNDEFDDFVKSMDEPVYRALRVNTLKCDKAKAEKLLPFLSDPTPFCADGYYIESDTQHIGTHPLHHAGAIYVQEPSAMSAVSMLAVESGDKVLDLCAAPGSKTTQIASALNGTGLLWSNEIVTSRANILLSNLERCGVKNAVVSSASPEKLCEQMCGYFDKVLVDAPCSGEGMFRKDEKAKAEWSLEHTRACANRQLMILNSAKKMLKAGGVMVYSTCTFNRYENEDVVEQFLRENDEFELIDSGEQFGRNTLTYAKRIYPMDGGEGHFAAKMRKRYTPNDEQPISKDIKKKKPQKQPLSPADTGAYDFVSQVFESGKYENLYALNDKVYALSDEIKELLDYNIDFRKIGVIKMGVEVLQRKGNRYEPVHNAFTACSAGGAKNVINLDIDDQRLYKFLHGEEIQTDSDKKGYALVCVENIPLGFGKISNGVLKNKYPKGLRNNG